MGAMTTGIDRLVSLVQSKKKVSLSKAAKELNLSEEVVEEWAEVLAEQKIFKLSYHFQQMYLEPLQIDVHTSENSAKKLFAQRQAFTRKIEATIKAIDRDTAGFDQIKREFNKVQSQIKDELETINSEISYLESYEKQKNNMDKEIAKQKKDYDTFIKEFNDQLKKFESDHNKLVGDIEKEEHKLIELEKQVNGLKDLKNKLEKTITTDLEKLKHVSSEMNVHLKEIEKTESRLNNAKKQLDSITSDVDASKKKRLQKLAKDIGVKQSDLIARQDELVQSAKDRVDSVKNYASIGANIAKSFDKSLSKKLHTTKLLDEVDADRQGLKDELEKLRRKVAAFNITTKSAVVKKQLAQVEETIASYEKKEKALAGKFEKLLTFLKGE